MLIRLIVGFGGIEQVRFHVLFQCKQVVSDLLSSKAYSVHQLTGGTAQGHLNNLSQIFYRFTDKKVSLC